MNFAENSETPPGMSEEEIEARIMGVVLIDHFVMKKGVDIFSGRAETEVMKDMQKIRDMNTCKPMDTSTLTYQNRTDALDSILFITDNINGDIKSRTFAVGSKQRTYNEYNKRNG